MTFLIFVIGLLFGSFGGSVTFRLPAKMLREWEEEARQISGQEPKPEEPWLDSKRSHCHSCHHQLHWYDLIPVFSWLFMRGKCRYCGVGIPVRYPLMELGGGVLALAAFLTFGLTIKAGVVFAALLLLLWLTIIDIGHMLLPDLLVYLVLWMGLLAAAFGQSIPASEAIMGAATGYASLAVPAWVYARIRKQEGMGNGDYKLLAAIGAFVGPLVVWHVLLLASVGSVVVQLAVMYLRKLDKNVPMPFGPALAASGAIAILGFTGIVPAIVTAFLRLI